MQVLKTRAELEALFLDSTASLGYLSFNRKISASQFHPGHEHLITYCNENFDHTIVSFWNGLELIYKLYGGSYFLDEIGLPWDSTGCLDWCEARGVDYAIVPDDWYSTQYLQEIGVDTSSLDCYALVDGIWAENNYQAYDPTPDDASLYNQTLRAKTFIMLQNYKNTLNTTFVSSWKDGEPRFTIDHYISNHSSEDYHLIDPIKTPDGLYYSSGYMIYTQAQKDLLYQVEGVVDSVGYSDTTALTSALEALNTGVENFDVRRIDVTYGGVVGYENDFVRVMFTMDGHADSFPIYKKGVR